MLCSLASDWHSEWIFAVHLVHPVDNRRCCGNQIERELPLEPLLNDFHVQQTEKTAAEAESQGKRRFRLIGERRIVQLQLCQGIAQLFILTVSIG